MSLFSRSEPLIKYFLETTVLVFVALFLVGLPTLAAGRESIDISVPVSPSSIPAYYLQENSDLTVNTVMHKNRNVVLSKLMKDDVDMALLSTNEAAKLYSRGVDIKVVNVHTWGLFYLITTEPDLESWEDLPGTEVYVPERGGPMDIIFSFVAEGKGIDLGEVDVQRGKPRQISQLMINGMAETAVLREPFVSQVLVERPQARVLFDLQLGWEDVTGMKLPQAVLAVKGDFVEDRPGLVAELNNQYSEAIGWTNGNVPEAAKLAREHMNTPVEVTELSAPRLNLNFKRAIEVRPEIENYLKLLMDKNRKSIGGMMPGEDFYVQT